MVVFDEVDICALLVLLLCCCLRGGDETDDACQSTIDASNRHTAVRHKWHSNMSHLIQSDLVICCEGGHSAPQNPEPSGLEAVSHLININY
jgi:hypothetical protein